MPGQNGFFVRANSQTHRFEVVVGHELPKGLDPTEWYPFGMRLTPEAAERFVAAHSPAPRHKHEAVLSSEDG